jgi:hypothetical protein
MRDECYGRAQPRLTIVSLDSMTLMSSLRSDWRVPTMAQTRYDPQGLLIQLETALHCLAESFWDQPYRFFTEADAMAGLQRWLATRPEMAQTYCTADDGLETGLLHREYPAFFHLRDQQPTERLSTGGARGHYDLVLLNPARVRNCKAEELTNRTLGKREEFPAPPLLAAERTPGAMRDTRTREQRAIDTLLGAWRRVVEENLFAR